MVLPDPPPAWGWGDSAYCLVGALPCSGRWRGWLAERDDQAHLVEGLDAVVRRLGGVTERWRFDRMSTVASPTSGRLQPSFGPVALHYMLTERRLAFPQVNPGVSLVACGRGRC